MQAVNWEVLNTLLDTVFEIPEAERLNYIKTHVDDSQTQQLALRLVAASARSTGFLATDYDAGEAAFTLDTGEMIGHWRVMQPLGLGGMGEVYQVERADGQYRQRAALKLIMSESLSAWQRFQQERQTLAELEHPNIGRLIDGGVTAAQRPYLVMEFIDGVPITQYMQQHNLSLASSLKLFMSLCEAITYAHSQLVLHKDIKPQNVLVNHQGDVKLIDFGVASLLSVEESSSATPMTLSYAAPEQLTGDKVSVATDVYGLGALLHEMLLDTPPVLGKMDYDKAAKTLPADLFAIIAKTLSREASTRYASAGALKQDVANYLQNYPVSAQASTGLYIVRKFFARHKLTSLVAVAAIVALTAGIVSTSLMANKAQQEAQKAIKALAEAQHASNESDRLLGMQMGLADAYQLMLGGETPALSSETVAISFRKQAIEIHKQGKLDHFNAHKLVAFGQFFGTRNDYNSTIVVLEKYFELGGYNSDIWLNQIAEYFLARAYQDIGRNAEAVTLFRSALGKYAGSYYEYYPEHSAAASALALASREQKDIAHAIEIIKQTQKTGKMRGMGESVANYLKNQLALLYTYTNQNGWQLALDTLNVPLNDGQGAFETITNSDTIYVNAARFAFYAGKPSLAAQYISLARKLTKQKGPSKILANVLHFEARLCFDNGDIFCAQQKAEQAEKVYSQFTSKSDKNRRANKALLWQIAVADGAPISTIVTQITVFFDAQTPRSERAAIRFRAEQALITAKIELQGGEQSDKAAAFAALESAKTAAMPFISAALKQEIHWLQERYTQSQ